MKIELDKTMIDLGFTPVENMFIHTYLAMANGDQIKVYLYALSQVYSNDKQEIDNKNIAFEMKLTEGQVIDAWRFWQDLGLVEILGDRYIFKSLRSGYINQIIGVEEEVNQTDKPDLDSSKYHRNDGFKKLINDIEEFISSGTDLEFPLSNREIEQIDQQIKDFNLTYEFYNYAFALASVEVSTKNIGVITGVIRNWVMDGATDEDKLNQLLEKKARARDEKKTQNKAKMPKKKASIEEDKRMSREERIKFIEEKMKKRKSLLEED